MWEDARGGEGSFPPLRHFCTGGHDVTGSVSRGLLVSVGEAKEPQARVSLDCFSPGVRAPCLCAGVECFLGRSASFGAWCTVETCVQVFSSAYLEKKDAAALELLDVCVGGVRMFNFSILSRK